MSATLIAIPVIKDSRKFHFEKGKRWTIVEHIVLEALAKQDWTIDQLSKASSLPRRVIIEVVIRLMRAGWVELKTSTNEIVFATTPRGRVEATREFLQPVTTSMSRWVGYVVELSFGHVFRARDLITLTEDQWKSRRANRVWAEVPAQISQHKALPDLQVLADKLLETDEDLTRVDIQDWRPRRLMGMVSVRNGKIEGISGDIPDQLQSAIHTAAGGAAKSSASSSIVQSVAGHRLNFRPRISHPISFRPDDIIIGGASHLQALKKVLTHARYRVVIHSTFIDHEKLQATLELMRAPLARGAIIDVLWGQSREKNNVNKTREAAIAFRELITSEGLSGRVNIHMSSTRSHAKLILADAGDPDKFNAVIGSCNWLSSDFGSFDVSICLRDRGIVSDVALDLAELARPRDGQVPDFSTEMLRLGRRLQTLGLNDKGRGVARIITAPEHAGVITEARENARIRAMILSHRLDRAAKPVLSAIGAAKQNNGARQLFAYYGRPGDQVSPEAVDEARKWAKDVGVELDQSAVKMHAKVLAWDSNDVFITSLNFLSADPGDTDPRQEIGVYIQAHDAANIVFEAYKNSAVKQAS